MLIYGFAPGWQILFLPLFIITTFVLALGWGLILATLNIEFRDFRYIVPFIIQFGVFVSPIAFESSAVPNEWRIYYNLNPLVGIIDGFRWSILGGRAVALNNTIVISSVVAIVSLVFGIWYFRRMERTFADVI